MTRSRAISGGMCFRSRAEKLRQERMANRSWIQTGSRWLCPVISKCGAGSLTFPVSMYCIVIFSRTKTGA